MQPTEMRSEPQADRGAIVAEIPAGIDRLAQIHAHLRDRLELLDNRLTAHVASPQEPTPEKLKTIEMDARSPLGRELDAAILRAQEMADLVESILSRLHI